MPNHARKEHMHDEDEYRDIPDIHDALAHIMRNADPRLIQLIVGMAESQEAMDENPILHHAITEAWPSAIAFMN